jgi:ABC-type polysaccharide/polyol phosphate export permease
MDFLLAESGSLISYLEVIFVGAVKFVLAFIPSEYHDFNFLQTMASTAAGGIAGVLFFYFLSGWLIRQYRKYNPMVRRYFGFYGVDKRYDEFPEEDKKVPFYKKENVLTRFVRNFGFFWFIVLTPVLISIPIGAFLAKRYYANRRNTIVYLSISVVAWSLVLSTIFILF